MLSRPEIHYQQLPPFCVHLYLWGNNWRRQALAIWGINPTNARFWDNFNATSMGPNGWPTQGVTTAGTDVNDYEGAGEWGLIVSQDVAQIRNILIRRYTDPEPILAWTPNRSFTSSLS